MWLLFLSALALVFVIEGILPFLCPSRWRDMMQALSKMQNKHLRMMGLSSMLIGLLILFILHNS